MVGCNKAIRTTRCVIFSAVCVLSVVELVIACHILARANDHTNYYDTLAGLGLATAILSLLILPFMVWSVDHCRGHFTSYIVTELAWCTELWILWVATGAVSTRINDRRNSRLKKEAQAFEALAFFNFFVLLVYTTALCVVASMSHRKGHCNVWKSSVKGFDFNAALSQRVISDAPADQQGERPQKAPQQPDAPQQPLAP